MSHTTTISKIVFTDKAALRSAIKELKQNGVKCDLLENATPRAYYDNQQGLGTAPMVVKLHDARYDIGLYQNDELKGLEARTDFYGGTVQKVLGAKARAGEDQDQARIGKLYQMYGIHAATRKATQQGFMVRRSTKADGTVQLQLTGSA